MNVDSLFAVLPVSKTVKFSQKIYKTFDSWKFQHLSFKFTETFHCITKVYSRTHNTSKLSSSALYNLKNITDTIEFVYNGKMGSNLIVKNKIEIMDAFNLWVYSSIDFTLIV